MRSPEKIIRPGRVNPRTGKRVPTVRWQVTVPLGDKKKRTVLFATKEDANAFAIQQERERNGGLSIDPNKTFDGIVKEFQASAFKRARPRTVRGYQRYIAPLGEHFDSRLLRTITPSDVEQYSDEALREMQSGERQRVEKALVKARRRLAWAQRQPPGTVDPSIYQRRVKELDARSSTVDRHGRREVNKRLQMLKRILGWAHNRQYVAFNAAAAVMTHSVRPRIDQAEDERVYNAGEARALLAAADPGLPHTALSLMIYSGIRGGEMRALHWDDFEPKAGRIWVHRGVDDRGDIDEPKTKAAHRFVGLTSPVVKELKLWKLACPPGPLMFPNEEGGVMDDGNFRKRVFQRAQRRAGLRAIPLHNLRHTCASMMIAAGADHAALSKHMGHANIAITLGIYGHWFERRSDSGVAAKLEAFLAREHACDLTAISGSVA